MKRSWKNPIFLLFISLVSTGCMTPLSVRNLASHGAASVDRAESETRAFVDRATQAYKRREAIVHELAKGDLTDRATVEFNVWLSGEAEFKNDRAISALIKKIADARKESREKLQSDLESKSNEIAKAFGSSVQISATNFSDTKRAFLILAQELSPQEWLEFGLNYAKQVREDIKALEQLPVPGAEPSK